MKWSIILSLFIWTVILTAYHDFQNGGNSMTEVVGSPVQYKRLFIDIPISTDAKAVEKAKSLGLSKKAYVEQLILNDTAKPATKKRNK